MANELQTRPSRLDATMTAVLRKVEALLVPGETMQAYAAQELRFATWHFQRRGLIAATSGRLITISRSLFGGFSMHDMRWQDLKDARINEDWWGASLVAVAVAGPSFSMSGLDRVDAPGVYRLCQQQEQIWREKRHVTKIEEDKALRAASVPMMASFGAGNVAQQPPSSPGDSMARLQAAKKMLDDGLISDTEYERIKAKVITGL